MFIFMFVSKLLNIFFKLKIFIFFTSPKIAFLFKSRAESERRNNSGGKMRKIEHAFMFIRVYVIKIRFFCNFKHHRSDWVSLEKNEEKNWLSEISRFSFPSSPFPLLATFLTLLQPKILNEENIYATRYLFCCKLKFSLVLSSLL